MAEDKFTHYHIADNSDAFRDWLHSKSIQYERNGHFTTIPLEGNDIFRLGIEFGLYKDKAQNPPPESLEKLEEEISKEWEITR